MGSGAVLAWVFIAIGLVLVVEGLFYALAPSLARKMAEAASATAPGVLRMGGLIAVAAGVVIVALGKWLG